MDYPQIIALAAGTAVVCFCTYRASFESWRWQVYERRVLKTLNYKEEPRSKDEILACIKRDFRKATPELITGALARLENKGALKQVPGGWLVA